MSAYEAQRLATISQNRAVLESLGLLDAVASMKEAGSSGTKQQNNGRRKPPKRAARPMSVPARPESERSRILADMAAKQAKEEADRRKAEEAAAEARREVQRKQRLKREAIEQRERERAARERVKREAERKARQQLVAQARRERDAEMRALRAERAEQQKRARQEARAERDAATAAVLEQVKARKSSLRTADDASLESALQRRAALEKAVEQRARLRGSSQGSSRGGRLAAAAVAEGVEVFWHVPGMCDSPGCMFPNHHLGPCSHEIVKPGSRRASSIGINYCEPDETDLNREYGLLKPYRRGEGADEAKPAPKKAKPAPLAADRMLATGHVYIGRRVARLFGRRLVLGTIVRWLPGCKASGAPALFRAIHDDGDEEDLEEAEVADARGDYETLAPRETRWLKVGHRALQQRVCRLFEGARVYGTVVKWLPPDLSEGDPSLFLVRHDDGDREELEQNELETALTAFSEAAAAEGVGPSAGAPEVWRLEGHRFVGSRVARPFDGARGGVQFALATIIKWLPAGENPETEPALFRAVHDDADEEDLVEAEVEEGLACFGRLAMERAEWRPDGHKFVGAKIARRFGKRTVLARISKWLPADETDGEPALFRAVHDDGDEEDLEEAEAAQAIAMYQAMPERRTTRVSAA